MTSDFPAGSLRMSSVQPEAQLFVDRSLGSCDLCVALRERGLVVHTVASVFGAREAPTIDDSEWIDHAAQRGWLCLVKDRLHKRPALREALLRAGAKTFCLAEQYLQGPDQIDCFLANLERIIECGREPGPYLYSLYGYEVRRLWPGEGGVAGPKD